MPEIKNPCELTSLFNDVYSKEKHFLDIFTLETVKIKYMLAFFKKKHNLYNHFNTL